MSENKKDQGLISQIEISAVIHSTENIEKVKKAVGNLLPEPPDASRFKVKHSKGHYGNPIKLLTLTVSTRNQAYLIFKNLLLHLSEESKKIISNNLKERMDSKGSLYLRFNKQSAIFKVLKLMDNDPIRMKIRFRKKVSLPSLRKDILRVISNEKIH